MPVAVRKIVRFFFSPFSFYWVLPLCHEDWTFFFFWTTIVEDYIYIYIYIYIGRIDINLRLSNLYFSPHSLFFLFFFFSLTEERETEVFSFCCCLFHRSPSLPQTAPSALKHHHEHRTPTPQIRSVFDSSHPTHKCLSTLPLFFFFLLSSFFFSSFRVL